MVHIPFPLPYFHIEILESWFFFALLPSMPLALDSSQVTSFHEGRIHLALCLLIFKFFFQLERDYYHPLCRNPTLAKCGGETQHLEKVRIWSPPGLLNVQNSTARLKTPRIEVFLVSLERS